MLDEASIYRRRQYQPATAPPKNTSPISTTSGVDRFQTITFSVTDFMFCNTNTTKSVAMTVRTMVRVFWDMG